MEKCWRIVRGPELILFFFQEQICTVLVSRQSKFLFFDTVWSDIENTTSLQKKLGYMVTLQYTKWLLNTLVIFLFSFPGIFSAFLTTIKGHFFKSFALYLMPSCKERYVGQSQPHFEPKWRLALKQCPHFEAIENGSHLSSSFNIWVHHCRWLRFLSLLRKADLEKQDEEIGNYKKLAKKWIKNHQSFLVSLTQNEMIL